MKTNAETIMEREGNCSRPLGPIGRAIRHVKRGCRVVETTSTAFTETLLKVESNGTKAIGARKDLEQAHTARARPEIGFLDYIIGQGDELSDFVSSSELEQLHELRAREDEVAAKMAQCNRRVAKEELRRERDEANLEDLDKMGSLAERLANLDATLRLKRQVLRREWDKHVSARKQLINVVYSRLADYFAEYAEMAQDSESSTLEEWGVCGSLASHPVRYAAFYWWERFYLNDPGELAQRDLIEALLSLENGGIAPAHNSTPAQ